MGERTEDVEWSVRDLASIAGTTVRTIHYYIAEGLLPPAHGSRRSAYYTPAHLARLRVIAALRHEGLALASIRSRLAPLSDDQVASVVAALDEHLARNLDADAPLSTLGLIEAAVSREVASDAIPDDRRSQPQEPPVDRQPASMPYMVSDDADRSPGGAAIEETASAYLARVMGKTSSRESRQPIQKPRRFETPQPGPVKRNSRVDIWHRLEIEDGIELHVREDRFRMGQGRMRAVSDALRGALRRYGLSPPPDPDDAHG